MDSRSKFTDTPIAVQNSIPKITMPSMPSGYMRERLCTRFGALEAAALIWVSAPAGYGKTTAVSSYLRQVNRATIWYQCDATDGDIASFFHFMTLARLVRLAGHGLRATPEPSTPEFAAQYLPAVSTFCRNYLQRWFAGFPNGVTLVLDDWQWVPPGSPLAPLLPLMIEQVASGCQIILISRSVPDAELSRLIAGRRVGHIGIADLALTRAETAAIATQHFEAQGTVSPLSLDRLFDATQGWATGLTLLLRADIVSSALDTPLYASQEIVDYLTAETFDRLPVQIQEFLLSVACLDYISTAVAASVSGRHDAASILDGLVRQNVFTVYRAESECYRFHPLFRSFLQRRLNRTYSMHMQRDWLKAAARALHAEGNSEAAIGLLIQAQSWAGAGTLICSVAERCIDSARIQTLMHWIESLPPATVTADGWLLYWRGTCRLTTEFGAARDDFRRAYERFAASHDDSGEMLACAAMLQHITYTYLDYGHMLPWLERLDRCIDAQHEMDAGLELKVRAAFMLALSQAIPSHEKLMDNVARVSALVRAESHVERRADGVSALLHFFSRFGRTTPYSDLDVIIEDLLGDSTLSSIKRINLLWLKAYQLHFSGDVARVLAILADARAKSRKEGLYSQDLRMKLCELQAQDIGKSVAATLATFSELEPLMRAMPVIPRAHFLYVRALFELECGNKKEALAYAEQSVPLVRSSRWYIGEALALTGLAEVYCAFGRFEDAARCIAECNTAMSGVDAPLVEFNTRLVSAQIARHTESSDEFTRQLAAAFAIGREQGYANGFHTGSQLLRQLIPAALTLGIEVSYCRWVAVKRRFAAPAPNQLNWPWPVKIKALGRLQIFLASGELILGGKAQRKPLDVLKLLIARPQGMDSGQLMDRLWPDLDGDAARNALDIAVHRLRKLLQAKDAVVMNNGGLALNKDVVWLDTVALEYACGAAADVRSSDEILELYRGCFLESEELTGPLHMARDKLRSKFVQTVVRLATIAHERASKDEAHALYVRAIDREPLEETLHRGFASVLRAQGNSVLANGAWECWQALAHTEGDARSDSAERAVAATATRFSAERMKDATPLSRRS